jgi:hypothetical protein
MPTSSAKEIFSMFEKLLVSQKLFTYLILTCANLYFTANAIVTTIETSKTTTSIATTISKATTSEAMTMSETTTSEAMTTTTQRNSKTFNRLGKTGLGHELQIEIFSNFGI